MASSKRPPRKGKRKEGRRAIQRRLIYFFAAFLCLWLIYSIVGIRIDIYRDSKILEELKIQVEEQKILNEELARILHNEGGAEYMERIAREKLGYVAQGEWVFVDNPS